ncbi:hypothetical protein [Yinghuangia seranimata]|uniref:hypothetical protein n=1 Tax=Yinghuangia seranimata TaxID=408067 RepID=UPI00248ADA5A|nr:hypothetical protein [Yinghuangia seranimata]MDI2125324.1 hypothetical protein [Yinghuangia seranimata]
MVRGFRRPGRLRPRVVQAKLAIPFVGEISGEWAPQAAERDAAWELYVELVTRVSIVPLPAGGGLLREAFTSLHDLFDITRSILRKYGADTAAADPGRMSFAAIAIGVLNGIRPLLTTWHPELLAYEATRADGVSVTEHERAWPPHDELRQRIADLQTMLRETAELLREACGAASLLPALVAVPSPTAPPVP